MQRIREISALLLIGLLPFHALLVTVLTKLIAGPGQAPLPTIALWKEGVLGLILLIAVYEIVLRMWRNRPDRLLEARMQVDTLDVLMLLLLALSVLVHMGVGGSLIAYLTGFRYDFVAPIAFLILRRVEWSDAFAPAAMHTLLWVAGIMASYGLLTLVLPDSFFAALGYSDLHSLYIPDRPIAAFQYIGESAIPRMQSAMSGPNHLGAWLLLPFGMLLSVVLQQYRPWSLVKEKIRTWLHLKSHTIDWHTTVLLAVVCIAIVLTFSRSAVIGAFVMLLVGVWSTVPLAAMRKIVLGLVATGMLVAVILLMLAPSVVLRLSSSSDHIARPLEALERMVERPLGSGLGAAGPASNRLSDSCVYLAEGSDASWAVPHGDLCVFVGDAQTQPIDRSCNCPFLPENWYLQFGVEMGWIGMVFYLAFMMILLRRLLMASRSLHGEKSVLARGIFLGGVGLAVMAIFLHAFEDGAVSYSLFLLAAVLIPVKKN